jgi:hypothetical protein
MPDYGIETVWLLLKPSAGRQFLGLQRPLCGSNHDTDVRPAVTHLLGQRQAVDRSRHVYVSEEQLNVEILCQEFERLVTVHSLDHPESGVLEHADRREANQSLVFDDQDHRNNFLRGHAWQHSVHPLRSTINMRRIA